VLVFDLGIVGSAVGITLAHELMHRTNRLDRALAEAIMTSVSYPWFSIEHVHGHHKRIGTPDDPATSRFGESLYAFLPRTLRGGLKSALEFERTRAVRRNYGRFDLRNRFVRYAATTTTLWVAIYLLLGPLGLLAFVGQSVVAIILLETINYIEHYGLQRAVVGERGGKKTYERVQPRHSWNSSHVASNRFLSNLARHSDHHANANRPYELLRHIEAAPQLPAGYGGMFLIAFVPPLYFHVMDPLVRAWNAQQRSVEAGPQHGLEHGGVVLAHRVERADAALGLFDLRTPFAGAEEEGVDGADIAARDRLELL
jgi:alkane 1-monooxygenase